MNNITRWTKEDPPNTCLAIDPGAAYPKTAGQQPYAGAALFQWGMLVWAALVRCPTTVSPFARPNALVRKVCAEANIARHGWSPKDNPRAGRGIGGSRKNARDIRTTSEILGEGLDVLAVENPLIYTKGTARPKDIVDLKGIYGAFMGGIDAEFYAGPSPQEWKGSVDSKEIVNERVATILNSTEKTVLVLAQRAGAGGLSDHVLDAVGIGLFVLGRMGKGGVV